MPESPQEDDQPVPKTVFCEPSDKIQIGDRMTVSAHDILKLRSLGLFGSAEKVAEQMREARSLVARTLRGIDHLQAMLVVNGETSEVDTTLLNEFLDSIQSIALLFNEMFAAAEEE